MRSNIPPEDKARRPAKIVYSPPSPIADWIGTATWERMAPNVPRINELHETAEALRPFKSNVSDDVGSSMSTLTGLASTRYAKVLE